MKSLRQAAAQAGIPESQLSGRRMALRYEMASPVSLFEMIERMKPVEERTFHGDILTPAGTALGGWVDLTLRSNGTYSYRFHVHDSGIPDYDFQVRALFTTPGGVTLVAQHSGHVEGTGSTTLTHAPNRDSDHAEEGSNPLIRLSWDDIKVGSLWVTKEYSATGVVGFVQDLAKVVLDVGATAVGGALGVVLALGAEAGQLFGNLGLGATFGVVAGVVVFAVGGSIVLAVAAGAAVGAVTEALIKQRPLRAEEVARAKEVFGDSLRTDRIVLTNMSGLGGRAFTMPGVDGKTYLNMGPGKSFDNPLEFTSDSNPVKGELLIHELTHAWQIQYSSFLPGLVCRGVVNQARDQVGQSVYVYGPPGPAWSSFNLEQQGSIVDEWFAGIVTPVVPNRKAMDPNDPYFRYIRDNIRASRT